jgi:NAD(P)-dependent dehydrogenase (short-subunit alcohol dehydrogenase family)
MQSLARGDFIGGEIAKKFASEGFTVFAGRRNGAKLEPLVKEIEAAGGEIHARSLDARKEEEITAFPCRRRQARAARSVHLQRRRQRQFRSSKPPSACSARFGKWRAIPVSSPAARRHG